MTRKLTLVRDVPKTECPWLEVHMTTGMSVFEYLGSGDILRNDDGIACTWIPDQAPAFTVPRDALSCFEPVVSIEDACDFLTGAKESPDYADKDMTPSPKALKRRKAAARAAARNHGKLRRKKVPPLETIETGLF